MGYTSVDQIRPYLRSRTPIGDRVTDQVVTLRDTEFVRFFGGLVQADSVRAKLLRADEPTRVSVTLGDSPTVLAGTPLVRGSVLLASDSSLGTVFKENSDFIVDYGAATVAPTAAGALSSGQTVTAWFLPYTLGVVGQDYQIKADTGEIKRLAGGVIESGETVFLDYSPQCQGFEEELLAGAVDEANGLVEREVDPDGLFGADPMLGAAAASRALEILCRAAAMRDLSTGPNQAGAAQAWLKLAEEFATRADRLLQSFHPPVAGPSGPTLC
ncbi:MAG: hypothetical protein AB1644_07200 [Candidatus Zixiibacteriota bacterium]